MGILWDQLLVYKPADSLREFVEFWAGRYKYPNEQVYGQYINGPHTPKGLVSIK